MEKPPNNETPDLEEEESKKETDSDPKKDLPIDEFGKTSATVDPVQAALAVAESIAPKTGEYNVKADLKDDEPIDDAASLKQVIDRVEQHIEPDLGPMEEENQSIPEELDALDIQPELGRPDVEPRASHASHVTKEELISDIPPPPVDEDTDDDIPPPPLDDEDPEYEDEYEEDDKAEEEDDKTAFVQSDGLDSIGLRFKEGSRWHGSLEDDPLWRLLTSIQVDNRSGALILENANIERKLYLDEGEVVVATSTARDDRLVELLYREGRLGDDEYKKAARTVGTSGRRVGAVLVERGLIASRELFPLVRHHYESIIFDTFSWREGIWRYDPEASVGERIMLESKTPALILEGIRSQARPEDVETLAPYKCHPMGLPSSLCKIEDVGLVPEELDIYKACDGTVPLDKLASGFDIGKRELQKMIAGLAALRLVQVEKGQVHSLADDSRVSGGDIGAQSGIKATRARVLEKINLIKEGSYFAILEIKDTASGYEIRKAYKRLKAEFALERFAVSALVDIRPHSEIIYEILEEAYEVLRDTTRRESYRQGIKDDV